jgi:hypothetical protein
MAIGDTPNQNLFGTNYNAEDEERKKAELAAQNARIGAAGGTQDPNNKGGFFEPGGFGYEYLGPRLGENIGKFAGEQLYGTGRTAEGQVTGFPVDRPSLAGDLLTFPGQSLRALDFVAGPPVRAIPEVVDYVTGASGVQSQQEALEAASAASDLEATSSVTPPVETPSEGAQEQGQSIPQGAPGSAQANFATRMATGKALSPQEIQDAQALAASMGTTFDPATGYSREAFNDSQAAPDVLDRSIAFAMGTGDQPFIVRSDYYGDEDSISSDYMNMDEMFSKSTDAGSAKYFNTPMTGMRSIDPITGEPVSQLVKDISNEIGLPDFQASVPLPKAPQKYDPVTYNQEETRARLGGRTLNEYLNAPPVRTPGISGLKTDPQGRMIPNVPSSMATAVAQPSTGPVKVPNELISQVARPAAQTMEFRDGNKDGIEDRDQGIFRPGELLGYDAQGNEVRSPGTQQPVNRTPADAQPSASALSDFEKDSLSRQQRIGGTGSFEGDSDARDARVRASDRQPGESQADRDTRVAQSKTTGGQTGGMSFDDARRRAEGQLAARGVKNPFASQVNALARSIQAGEPERLAELETKRAKDAVDLKTAQATLNRPEFEGRVYTVNGVTFAQTSRGGAQVIDTGTETSEESTAKMKDFVFALEQIDKARKAYQAGDIDKANDIITAAGIQKNGFDVTASEYFGGSAPSGTASGLTEQQEANIQKVLAANPGSKRADVIEAMQKKGKL